MAYNVTITYTPANDLFNIKAETQDIVTPAPYAHIPTDAPSDAYIYAPDGATTPVFNKENFITIDSDGKPVAANTYITAGYNTSGQKRWPKTVTDSISYVLDAYKIPQVPVYRAWQTFKLAIAGGSTTFEVATFAEADFYADAGKALAKCGITVTVEEVTEDGGEG